MERKTRKILFFILLIIFLFFAPIIVLYFQGYRIDFEKKSLTQTGGFFFKIEPKQVEIFIDGKLVKKTDFFFGSAFIENLLPKKYKILIEKEGYFPWEKELEIKEMEVTEAKKIILFPKSNDFNILTKNVENFWFSPNEKKIAIYETEGSEKPSWALKLYDLEKNIKSHLIDEKTISLKGVDFLNLEWSPDSKEIYLDVAVKEQIRNFVLKLDKIPPQLIERKITPLPENIIFTRIVNGETYSLDKFGYLLKNGEKLTREPFPVKEEAKYELYIFPRNIFIRENEVLYQLNLDSNSLEKFFDEIKALKFSPDYKKLAYFSNYEVWGLFLENKQYQPFKKVGEKLFLIRVSEKINDIFWLNSDYIIFSSGDKIKIIEIDDRDGINIIDFCQFKNPEIFWNQTDKKLYILTEKNLLASNSIF